MYLDLRVWSRVKEVRRAGLYQVLAILGFFLVLFLRAPLSVAVLSLIEPILIAILLTSLFISYYVDAALGRRYGVEESTPIFRKLLPSHTLIADGLMLLILALSLFFVWEVWASQPFRVFNATVLGTLWTGIGLTNRLAQYRRHSAQTTNPQVAFPSPN